MYLTEFWRPEGGTLDDATITGGINWYYKNVIVD